MNAELNVISDIRRMFYVTYISNKNTSQNIS